ncbi:phosphatidate cytidylyltransferase [Corynebacterium kutscheri]|uniref:Phosphatidate cytidylyltransferase n=1 Tax=Corynebacterium kutscheri TaxID=35755 RepID=A0A0F6R284_9CORY|nr:phosphatidate cytidylyltransferase [Corynebacterium kutscheri]AKE41468.1 CDP-diglyceride synthetase [Corynebacterium kutscheri]VEH08746.1 phosphatidate cytidylyltransferase [Corynebacterium kutscheri]VEH09792.1 phosphatidate cytidylyltransferase [Corynebacterium kutscheri]VEH79875.1 phosphatidate cytidylyltransferase [Corynebacterium kutscheri]
MNKLEHLPKPKNSAGRNLKAAISVGIGLGLICLVAIFVIPFGWYPLVALAIASATWEVLDRLKENGYVIHRWLCLAAGQAMVWSSWPFGPKGLVSAYVASVLVLMFSRIFHHGRNTPPKNYLRDTAVGIFVLTWIPLFGSFAAMLSLLNTAQGNGALFIVTFIVCVVASDTGGYIAGVMFGSHPMAPAVSPKKSWEGFAGSIILGAAAGIACVTLLLGHQWWLGLFMGLGLVVCATLGDLVESQFKRELGIKDMSNFLPGHGGLMDRLDGLLPSAMVTWLLLSVISVV